MTTTTNTNTNNDTDASIAVLSASLATNYAALLDMIRVAESSERYEDMCVFVKQMVDYKFERKQVLDVNERNLLSVAYKNVVGAKRAAWRTLNGGFENVDQELLSSYRVVIEHELEHCCLEVIALVTTKLLVQRKKNDVDVEVDNNTDTDTAEESWLAVESRVFYHKMVADYYRYLCEVCEAVAVASDDDDSQDRGAHYRSQSNAFYAASLQLSMDALPPTHPTRLGLALNFSVCYYEILNQPEKACALAKKAFDDAIEQLDTISEENYKDSTLIMQLLRDNLTLWTATAAEEEEEQAATDMKENN